MASIVSMSWSEELVCARAVALEGDRVSLSLIPKDPFLPAERNRLLLESVEAETTRVPGIVPIVEVEVERERIRIVTPRLDDQSMSLHTFLRALASRESIVTLPLAEFLAHQVGDALARLHGHPPSGVFEPVHGLLRPASILLEPGGKISLCGGGFPLLTRLLAPPGRTVLEDWRLLAPELLRGEAPSVRTDVYALGTTLFQVLVGAPYLQGVTESRLRERAITHAAPEFSAGIGWPSDRVVGAIAGALAPNPADRPADAAELAALLSEAREAAGLPRWTRETFASLQKRIRTTDQRSGTAIWLGLRASRAVPATRPVSRSSITRENLFDNLEIPPLSRKAPPPVPVPSDPPMSEIPAMSRLLSNPLAEALHVTDEMVQAHRTTETEQTRAPMIYGASMLLFGAAFVLTVLTLILFLST